MLRHASVGTFAFWYQFEHDSSLQRNVRINVKISLLLFLSERKCQKTTLERPQLRWTIFLAIAISPQMTYNYN